MHYEKSVKQQLENKLGSCRVHVHQIQFENFNGKAGNSHSTENAKPSATTQAPLEFGSSFGLNLKGARLRPHTHKKTMYNHICGSTIPKAEIVNVYRDIFCALPPEFSNPLENGTNFRHSHRREQALRNNKKDTCKTRSTRF